jgi:uncharacterized membrane protein YraQ (UPF0718 family)
MNDESNTKTANGEKLLRAVRKTLNSFRMFLPLLIGTVFSLGLVISILPSEFYGRAFPGHPILDPLVGAVLGAVSAGNAMLSYVIGGELLSEGVSLLAVSAFLATWVTVGFIQIPAESMMLGRRFTLVRNGIGFISALLVAGCLSIFFS